MGKEDSGMHLTFMFGTPSLLYLFDDVIHYHHLQSS